MDSCFAACGCEDAEGITKSDLDRFTDRIENVLSDEKGRKLFGRFMFNSKMKKGRRTLDFWEHVEKLLTNTGQSGTLSPTDYLRDIDRLVNEAERIEEVDLATMERLTIARDSENREQINEVLAILKVQAARSLKREYNAFRRHFVAQK